MKYNHPFFYFEPNIHVNIGQPNIVLIYNYTTAKERVINNTPFYLRVKQLLSEYEFGFYIDQDELYGICLTLKDDLLGDIIDIKDGKLPFLIPPNFFKVEKSRSYLSENGIRNFKDNILDYIFNLDFYMGLALSKSNRNTFPHLYPDNIIKEICFDEWNSCINDYKIRTNLQSINIYIASSINESPIFIKRLEESFESTYINIHIPYNLSNDYVGSYNKLLYFPSSKIEDTRVLRNFVNEVSESDRIIFIVESEKHFSIVEKIASKNSLDNYSVYPHFNGKNNTFFQSNVYMRHADLLEDKPSMIDLFRNSELNSNDFGRIVIDSFGNYQTNVLGEPLGNLKNENLQKIVFNCLSSTNSTWFQTRNRIIPCSECIYNQICPPISSYERSMNKMDLCWKNLS
ncbi:MAG: hypothetical protein HXX16_16925 [Bacteroidales bacterium]|nr:hypothetical protein [Bacteroidales bacterium]